MTGGVRTGQAAGGKISAEAAVQANPEPEGATRKWGGDGQCATGDCFWELVPFVDRCSKGTD